jgi:hypothetical protein
MAIRGRSHRPGSLLCRWCSGHVAVHAQLGILGTRVR